MPCNGANGRPKAEQTAVGGAINIYTMALRGSDVGSRAFFYSFDEKRGSNDADAQ